VSEIALSVSYQLADPTTPSVFFAPPPQGLKEAKTVIVKYVLKGAIDRLDGIGGLLFYELVKLTIRRKNITQVHPRPLRP
jgi:hypothetical protein